MYIVLRLQIEPHMEIFVEGNFDNEKDAIFHRVSLMEQYGVFAHIEVKKV